MKQSISWSMADGELEIFEGGIGRLRVTRREREACLARFERSEVRSSRSGSFGFCSSGQESAHPTCPKFAWGS